MGDPGYSGLTGLTGLSIWQWAIASRDALVRVRVEIDALNVFPVPDGDTGTNLYLTMDAACAELEDSGEASSDAALAATVLARGALLGARGNSGVILSQILRGIGASLTSAPDVDAHAVARALRAGADEAYRAVARPVEGTILTVARAAAEAAEAVLHAVPGEADLARVVGAASLGAREALIRTPSMLEALRQAGVVDAGGRGLVEVYDALVSVITGEAPTDIGVDGRRREGHSASPVTPLPTGAGARGGPVGARGDERPANDGPANEGPAFEIMYLLDCPDDRIDRLRAALDARGDSLVVVGGDGLWNVHVHADDAGACIEDALEVGRPHRIRVTSLHGQTGSHDQVRQRSGRDLVMVTHGPGIEALVESAGVRCVPALPRVRPSVAEIVRAVDSSHAPEVVLLPSDKDTQQVAELAAVHLRSAGRRVAIVPTRSVVQSLAAVAVHDPACGFDDDVVSMTRAASATRYGAITIAVRAALTSAGECAVGDVLGLVDGDIVEIGANVQTVSRDILDRMLAVGGELVTIVSGSEVDHRDVDALVSWLVASRPGIDVVHHGGGQPLWPLIVGVE